MKQDQFSKWHAIKVKARANYTCQKCGRTENIQAHDPTRKHTDWQIGIALCGDCHSKEHPDIPSMLFAISTHQPFWPNVSARTLAKQFGCHNRTIIRVARKLKIPMGKFLSPENKEKLQTFINPVPPTGYISHSEMANKLGITSGSLYYRLKQIGVMTITIGNHKFLSILQADKLLKFQSYRPPIERVCEICGKCFRQYTSARPARFCSNHCKGIWLYRNTNFTRKGKKNKKNHT